jgi:hypothetical protein
MSRLNCGRAEPYNPSYLYLAAKPACVSACTGLLCMGPLKMNPEEGWEAPGRAPIARVSPRECTQIFIDTDLGSCDSAETERVRIGSRLDGYIDGQGKGSDRRF